LSDGALGVGAAREGGWVDAVERVHAALIAADNENLGLGLGEVANVGQDWKVVSFKLSW
jgi:hypothetical protein